MEFVIAAVGAAKHATRATVRHASTVTIYMAVHVLNVVINIRTAAPVILLHVRSATPDTFFRTENAFHAVAYMITVQAVIRRNAMHVSRAISYHLRKGYVNSAVKPMTIVNFALIKPVSHARQGIFFLTGNAFHVVQNTRTAVHVILVIAENAIVISITLPAHVASFAPKAVP